MKLEVGMYVRIKGGLIDKIMDVEEEYHQRYDDEELKLYKIYKINKEFYDGEFDEFSNWIFEDAILKASRNIIDLIEVGDYVNGELVPQIETGISYQGIDEGRVRFEEYFRKHPIKSIVTKEQFESMSYKVGE